MGATPGSYPLFISFIPFIGYAFDKKLRIFSYDFLDNCIKQTLPTLNNSPKLKKNITKMTWNTFYSTNYFKKINWAQLNKIHCFEDSVFLAFHSNLKFYNKQQYIGIVPFHKNRILNSTNQTPTLKNPDYFFLVGRNFNHFFQLNRKVRLEHRNR